MTYDDMTDDQRRAVVTAAEAVADAFDATCGSTSEKYADWADSVVNKASDLHRIIGDVREAHDAKKD